MRNAACIGLLGLLVLSGCAAPDGARTPTPILTNRVPPASRDEDVAKHLANFVTGDERRIHEIEGRLDLLVPRPWTVERLAAYAAASLDPQELADLVYLLAASKDLLGLRVAGLALDHHDLKVRVAATYGILYYWIEIDVSGGTEQAMDAAHAFWQSYRDRLLSEPYAPASSPEIENPSGVEGGEFQGPGDFGVSVIAEPEHRPSTYEELVEVATRYAQHHGWKGVRAGKFVFKRWKPSESETLVFPLTVEALKRSGVRVEDADWLFVFAEK